MIIVKNFSDVWRDWTNSGLWMNKNNLLLCLLFSLICLLCAFISSIKKTLKKPKQFKPPISCVFSLSIAIKARSQWKHLTVLEKNISSYVSSSTSIYNGLEEVWEWELMFRVWTRAQQQLIAASIGGEASQIFLRGPNI